LFVDGKNYKATPGLWELLTKPKLYRRLVSVQDKQAYKQILLQSNAHRVNYSSSGKIKANKGVKYIRGLFHNCLLTQRKCLGNRYNNNNVCG